MPTILELIGAGLLVALISKYIINNKPLCDSICGNQEEEQEIVCGGLELKHHIG